MSSQKVNQALNVNQSQDINDGLDVSLALTSNNLEFDVNIIRSLIRLIVGGLTFFESPLQSIKQIVTPKGAFYGHQNSITQSIPQATQTKVLFQAEKHDRLSEFDPSTGLYTATVDGLYQFTACIGLDGVSAGILLTLEIIRNQSGTPEVFRKIQGVPSGETQVMVETTIYVELSAGDEVEVYLTHNDAGAKDTIAGVGETRFLGRKVDL